MKVQRIGSAKALEEAEIAMNKASSDLTMRATAPLSDVLTSAFHPLRAFVLRVSSLFRQGTSMCNEVQFVCAFPYDEHADAFIWCGRK